MSKLLSKKQEKDKHGRFQFITPENADWNYVGFEAYNFTKDQHLSLESKEREVCVVLISGKATIQVDEQTFTNIGDRMCPFEKKKPYAIYVPKQSKYTIKAITELEIAICSSPSNVSKETYSTRLIAPNDIHSEVRGKGNNVRHIHDILPENKPADSLLVVEVFTNEGNTSSYPSHKHDVNDLPNESYLEETYYHRIQPSQGFAMQRVYTSDGSLDECMAVYDQDVVKVPKGYHPVATIAGYNSYYLNVMAGPHRTWKFSFEKEHLWINSDKYRK